MRGQPLACVERRETARGTAPRHVALERERQRGGRPLIALLKGDGEGHSPRRVERRETVRGTAPHHIDGEFSM